MAIGGSVDYEAVLANLRARRALLDAAKKYLQSKGERQRTTQILGALQRGGVALTGKSPINSVGAVLNRNLKQGGEIVREKPGMWALASWHPQPNKKPEQINGAGTSILATVLANANSEAKQAEHADTVRQAPSVVFRNRAMPAAVQP